MGMLGKLKGLARTAAPGAYASLSRLYVQAFTAQGRLNALILRRAGGKIAGGPFVGMAYGHVAAGSRLTPKLVGTYEQELHPWMEEAIATAHDVVVDVGCAEGYYAVGLALRMPNARVIAYDVSAAAQDLCRANAQRNGVAARVDVRGACTPDVLAALDPAPRRPLVVCDCEGFENELLDVALVPWLSRAVIIVELHDCFVPGTQERLTARLSPTHTVEVVTNGPRDPSQVALLAGLPPETQADAVDENRVLDGQRLDTPWMRLTPRA